jgi:diacylglycerol kinase family enzyme
MGEQSQTTTAARAISAKINEKLGVFASDLAEIIKHGLVAPGKALRWVIIANPAAGGFTIHKRWEKHRAALQQTLEKARRNPVREDAVPVQYSRAAGGLGDFGLIPTTGAGHAAKITQAVLDEMSGAEKAGDEMAAAADSPFYLFITAGGDGTSLEVLQTLYHAPPAIRAGCAVLRLPLGTGNDGAEAWEPEDALDFLVRPTRIEQSRGLMLSTATGKTWPDGKPLLAFNILSVGLDAFVTHMTNKMKGKLPGDSYKLWVDIAALFYDKLYKTGPMSVRGFDENRRETANFTALLLLCAMGASGYRSYGSHKKILPDGRNVCAIKQMPLLRKIVLKELFDKGTHIDKPEAIAFNAASVDLSGRHPLLAQMDGETIRLEPRDFPVTIALSDPVIPVLKITQ